ncbi:MAG: hypothetical protein R3C03_03655 [Pirellulaceae bacterium]
MDLRLFAETEKAVAGAEQELAACQRLVERSLNDRIPDSRITVVCREEIEQRRNNVTSLRQGLNVAHSLWLPIYRAAEQATASLGIVAGKLVRELQMAEQAVFDFQTASNQVIAAAQFRGSYGVTVSGNPGSEQLESARRSLAEGDYQATIQICRVAAQSATEAIREAENLVESIRRRRVAEAARRRSERRRSSISFGGGGWSSGNSSSGGWSSGSSSGGWSSGSSSSGGSSHSSGSSGFSRSGW